MRWTLVQFFFILNADKFQGANMNLIEDTLLLASASPRRKELLEKMGVKLIVRPENIKEELPGKMGRKLAAGLAAMKLEAAAANSLNSEYRFLLAADTIVQVKGEVLGKPESREEAGRMLKLLSGRMHSVITGAAFLDRKTGRKYIKTVLTLVWFRKLTATDIEQYLDSGEYSDAAGAYKIQGMGGLLADRIYGSWSNVVGLPINLIYDILFQSGFFSG
jgi:septum formation protein